MKLLFISFNKLQAISYLIKLEADTKQYRPHYPAVCLMSKAPV